MTSRKMKVMGKPQFSFLWLFFSSQSHQKITIIMIEWEKKATTPWIPSVVSKLLTSSHTTTQQHHQRLVRNFKVSWHKILLPHFAAAAVVYCIPGQRPSLRVLCTPDSKTQALDDFHAPTPIRYLTQKTRVFFEAQISGITHDLHRNWIFEEEG